MDWYIFTESDRESRAPDFRLESSRGGWVSLDDYRQTTNLVLFFACSLDCSDATECLDALIGFIRHAADYRAEAAAVLAIFPAPVEALAGLDTQLGGRLPLLADPGGKVRRAYAELLDPDRNHSDLLFLLDRYGVPMVALAEGEAADPAIHKELLDWLTYAEIKCPE